MNKMLEIDLTLFDATAGASGAGAGEGSPAASTQGDNISNPGSTRRGKTGEFANVLFGKQTETNAVENGQAAAADSEVKVTSNTLEDRRKAYLDLVNSDEYKQVHTDEIQRIINRRFKETETLKSQVEKTQPLVDMLSKRYNIEGNDVDKLMEAIDGDYSYWEAAAEEAGMTVEQYKRYQKLMRENEQLKRAEEERRGKQFVESQTQKWVMEAEAVKAKFPKFDFRAELDNPAFLSMLKAGTPVEHAYKVVHFDELMSGAVNQTAINTQKAVVDNIRAKGARPAENGTAAQSAFTVYDDVHKLTKKMRAEIVERAAHGDRISF